MGDDSTNNAEDLLRIPSIRLIISSNSALIRSSKMYIFTAH